MERPIIKTKKFIIAAIFVCSVVILYCSGCYYDNEQYLYQFTSINCDSSNVTYSQTIAPILQTNCNSCHSASSASGGVITSGYTNVIILVNNGKLRGTVNQLSGFSFMPKGGNKLSGCDLAKINKWIHLGAPNN